MSKHFIEVCSCGQVIRQCRCAGERIKTVIDNGCLNCKAKAMKIYQSEIEAGLEEKIIASQRMSYASQLEVCKPEYVQYCEAAEHDNDLFYLQSVLVTTNKNLNDDIFSPKEVWAAKDTPIHKPTNLNHDPKQHVGHITSSWAIDLDENIIPANTSASDLPEVYHIVTGSVIYRYPHDKELNTRASQLIKEIEDGDMFVSMEVLFRAFDYGLSKGEEFKIVARNNDTSFLTKYLRAYGGEGVYDGYSVGRILRNLTFSAHGFVTKPANPDSIIFKRAEHFSFAKSIKLDVLNQSGVLLFGQGSQDQPNETNEREMVMADINELKDELKLVKAELADANKKLTEAGYAKLEDEKKAVAEELKVAQEELKAKSESAKANEDKVSELENKLDELNKEVAKYKEENEKAKAAELKANRISVLVDGGLDKEVATQKVEKFANLNDDQFKDYAEELVAAYKEKMKKDEKKDEKKEDKAKADETEVEDETNEAAAKDALDNIQEVKEPALSTSSESDDGEVKVSIAKFISNKIKSSKGRK